MKKRVTSIKVPFYIKAFAATLEKVSKPLALKFALSLFYKPFKHARPPREEKIYQKAERMFFEFKGRKIRYYKWAGGDKKVLLVHGWSGRGTQMNVIIENLCKLGYSVFSFDGPAHGDSEGKRTHMYELKNCIEILNNKYGPFHSVIGHSMGGVATMHAVANGVSAQKVVIIGTPNQIVNVISDFCMNVGFSDVMVGLIRKHLEDKYQDKLEDFSGEKVGKEMKKPLLIVHDVNDIDVLYSEAEKLHQEIEDSELFTTHNLGHRKILADQHVIDKITEFIA